MNFICPILVPHGTAILNSRELDQLREREREREREHSRSLVSMLASRECTMFSFFFYVFLVAGDILFHWRERQRERPVVFGLGFFKLKHDLEF